MPHWWWWIAKNKNVALSSVQHANADGVLNSTYEAFQTLQIPQSALASKVVAFTADGASVNMGVKAGVQAKLRGELPHLIDMWCLPHRLELAVKDSIKNAKFASTVLDMMELIYKTYHFSPKPRRELKETAMQLDASSNLRIPLRVKGTRWVPHTHRALGIMTTGNQQFAAISSHMQLLASAGTSTTDVIGRAKEVATALQHAHQVAFTSCMMCIRNYQTAASFSRTMSPHWV